MAKMLIIPLSYALILFVSVARSEYYTSGIKSLNQQEKVTHLHFFIHDTLSGKNPSAVRVAKSNLPDADKSALSFGSIYAIDDPLTAGPEPTSEVIGNAQGLYISSSQDLNKFTIVMYVDLAFTSGQFNGSSLSLFSRNPVSEGGHREVAVVGGRGKFRFARGFVEVRTSSFDATTGDAVLEYNVAVYHY